MRPQLLLVGIIGIFLALALLSLKGCSFEQIKDQGRVQHWFCFFCMESEIQSETEIYPCDPDDLDCLYRMRRREHRDSESGTGLFD